MSIPQNIARLAIASATLLGGSLLLASAATGTTVATHASTADTQLVASFSIFAGSPENAQSLVSGLRTGNLITLEPSPSGPNAMAPSASLTPATGKLGYGNVRIALSLAKAQLAKDGISNPTPLQLSTALNGVLTQRADGMGWGNIAHSMGTTLGSVMGNSHANKSGQHANLHAKAKTEDIGLDNSAGQGSGSGKSGNAGGHGNAGGNGNGGNGGNGGGKK